MLPTIYIGQYPLSMYWLMFAVGVLSMLVIMMSRKKRFTLNNWQTVLFTLCLMVCGVSGTKILYALESIPDILSGEYQPGGMSLFGAVFLIPIAMPLIRKLFSMRTAQTRDACAPCLAAMVAMLRFGCFFAGCCGGIEACVGGICFRWPTQLIDGTVNMVLVITLLHLENDGRFAGYLYPVFMLVYSVMRFFIEFLRDTAKDWLFLSHGQWFAILAIAVSVIWLASARRQSEGNLHG